jgi:sugar (pentulose or hexulose) kinase
VADHILALDVGTQSIRAILFSPDRLTPLYREIRRITGYPPG